MPASDIVKLRMKIGEHEFEAEGPANLVAAHFETWKQLAAVGATTARRDASDIEGPDATLRNLFTVDATQKSVTLRVKLLGRRRNADAALLILYGHRKWLANDGGEELTMPRLSAALAASGYRLTRVDRAIAPHLDAGLVRKGGPHKKLTYAMTAAGEQYAAGLARRLANRL